MILHRAMKHVKNHDWFAMILDVVVVIAGILIAIQMDEWNQARKDANASLSYYQRLIADFEADITNMEARLTYVSTAMRYGKEALDHLDSDAPADAKYLIALYQASQVWQFAGRRPTYDELLNKDIAIAIPDEQLRLKMSSYYLLIETSGIFLEQRTPYRQEIRSYLPDSIQHTVRAQCGDIFIFDERMIETSQLPQTCTLEFSAEQIHEAEVQLSHYKNLKTHLTLRLSHLDLQILEYQDMLKRTNLILKAFREQLAKRGHS